MIAGGAPQQRGARDTGLGCRCWICLGRTLDRRVVCPAGIAELGRSEFRRAGIMNCPGGEEPDHGRATGRLAGPIRLVAGVVTCVLGKVSQALERIAKEALPAASQLYPIGYKPQARGAACVHAPIGIESSATHPRWGLPPRESASGAMEESDLIGQLTRCPGWAKHCSLESENAVRPAWLANAICKAVRQPQRRDTAQNGYSEQSGNVSRKGLFVGQIQLNPAKENAICYC